MKLCSGCQVMKPATKEFFHGRKASPDGLAYVCKQCRVEYRKKYEVEYHDKILARKKAYRAKTKNLTREQKKRYYSKDPNRFKMMHRRYANERRIRKLGAEGTHTEADVVALYVKQEGKCAYCDVELNNNFHVDHIVPLTRGGSNWPDNLAIACAPCNWSKHTKLLEEWEGRVDYRTV